MKQKLCKIGLALSALLIVLTLVACPQANDPEPAPVTPTYSITVEGGTASVTTATAGSTVYITASGSNFKEWTTSSMVTFDDKTSSTTFFTMPDRNVTVTATFNGGGVTETLSPGTYGATVNYGSYTLDYTLTVVDDGTFSIMRNNGAVLVAKGTWSGLTGTLSHILLDTNIGLALATGDYANPFDVTLTLTGFIMPGMPFGIEDDVTFTKKNEGGTTTEGYTVTFNGNDYTSGSMAAQTFTKDVAQNLTDNGFSKTGYTFLNWKDSDGNIYTNGQSITVTKNLTLTAQWKANEYTLTFNAGVGGTVIPTSKTVTYDQVIGELPEPTRTSDDGFTFVEWLIGETSIAESTIWEYVEDQTAGGLWTNKQTYTVTFEGNGNTGGSMSEQKFAEGDIKNLIPNGFTRTGYTFTVWLDDSGNFYSDGAAISPPQNLILTAQWAPKMYTLTFDAGVGGAVDPISIPVTYDQVIGELPIPMRTGYSFNGWTVNSSIIMSTDTWTYTEDKTFVAQWEANTYTVTFDANGADGMLPNDMNFVYDESQRLPDGMPGLSKPGYGFKEWNTEANGEGLGYYSYQEVKNLTTEPNATVTLYAVWKEECTIILHENKGGPEDNRVNWGVFKGETRTMPAGNKHFTAPSGKYFKEWNTSADGSGKAYNAGSIITVNDDIEFYAIWVEIAPALQFGVYIQGYGTEVYDAIDLRADGTFTKGRRDGTWEETNNVISFSIPDDPNYNLAGETFTAILEYNGFEATFTHINQDGQQGTSSDTYTYVGADFSLQVGTYRYLPFGASGSFESTYVLSADNSYTRNWENTEDGITSTGTSNGLWGQGGNILSFTQDVDPFTGIIEDNNTVIVDLSIMGLEPATFIRDGNLDDEIGGTYTTEAFNGASIVLKDDKTFDGGAYFGTGRWEVNGNSLTLTFNPYVTKAIVISTTSFVDGGSHYTKQ